MEQNGEVDVSLQEVFSERQRYGRVARYELRPSRFGQAASSVHPFGEDQINSRRVPDFPLVRMILFSYNVSVSFPLKCNINKPQFTLSLSGHLQHCRVIKMCQLLVLSLATLRCSQAVNSWRREKKMAD